MPERVLRLSEKGSEKEKDWWKMKDEQEKPKMPLAVRIAFGWFVLLTVASVMPSVYEVIRSVADGTGFDRLISALVCNLGMAALCMGFALAVVWRKWSWVRVPYLVIGLVGVLPLCFLTWRTPTAEHALYLGMAVAMTAFPLVMLELPSAVRWQNAVRRKGDHGLGRAKTMTLLLVGLVLVCMEPLICASRASRMTMAGRQTLRGRRLFMLWTRNEEERKAGRDFVDVAACTNAGEFVERLCARWGGGTAAGRNEWSFAVNLPEDAPDDFPVMISANVDPSGLPRKWDGQFEPAAHDWLKPLAGAPPSRLGNFAMVVVRKGGAAQVIKRKYMIPKCVFNGTPYELGPDTYFLTPVGRRCVQQSPTP